VIVELQSVAGVFIERLLNTSAEGLLVAGVVWALLRLMRRQNSGTRFAIWFSVLLTMVALPFLSGSSIVPSQLRSLSPAHLHGQFTLSRPWALGLFGAWAVIACVLLFRVGIGLRQVRRYRRACSELDPAGLDPVVAAVLRDLGSPRGVRLLVSNAAAVPSAVGFFRPAVILPAWLFPQLSADELKLILIHELAHLSRWDDWTNLIQKIIGAVFFFHPAVWWIERHLTLEREMACDDMVLAQSASPRTYASSLILFAEKLRDGRALALAQTLLSRMQQMSPRLEQILDAKRPARATLSRPVLALSFGVLACLLGLASVAPTIVALQAEPGKNGLAQAQFGLHVTPSPTNSAVARSIVRVSAKNPRPARPRPILAAYRPRPLKVSPRVVAMSGQLPANGPAAVQRTSDQATPPIPETIFFVRTVQMDNSGHASWSLCIWRVRGNSPETQTWDSAVFVGRI
jgi:beta-lactamase regulating signal transducer with metallopeptidase domain